MTVGGIRASSECTAPEEIAEVMDKKSILLVFSTPSFIME